MSLADNQLRGPGAVWNFTSTLSNGQLLPDSLSGPRDFIFQLTDLRPFHEGTQLRLGLVTLDAKILGPAYTPSRVRAAAGRGEEK